MSDDIRKIISSPGDTSGVVEIYISDVLRVEQPKACAEGPTARWTPGDPDSRSEIVPILTNQRGGAVGAIAHRLDGSIETNR